MIAQASMNPMRFLNSTDSFERGVMLTVAHRRAGIARDERQDLAERIIGTLAKAMPKGKS